MAELIDIEEIEDPPLEELLPEPPAEPLDLTLPDDVVMELSDAPLPEQQASLPNLFDEKQRAGSKTSVSGKLLFDEEASEIGSSVSGAQVTVKRKIN